MNHCMSAAGQTVELVETSEIEMFLPVMNEIDLAIDSFSQCSIGAE